LANARLERQALGAGATSVEIPPALAATQTEEIVRITSSSRGARRRIC
jgi:hypothetical protein